MDRILSEYNSLNDSFFFHHSRKPAGEGSHYGPESHLQYELLYLISGKVTYNIDGESYEINPGDVILVSPKEIHTLAVSAEEAYERMVILFDLNEIKKMLSVGSVDLDPSFFSNHRDYRIIPGSTVRKTGLGDAVMTVAKTERSRGMSLDVFSGICKLAVTLDRIMSQDGKDIIAPSYTNPIVKRAVEYINEHITEPISLEDIADALSVSTSTLSHTFKRCTNLTPSKYTMIKKIYYASSLIRRGASSYEASLAIGCTNYTTFYYNYKKVIGKAPSDTKKQPLPALYNNTKAK